MMPEISTISEANAAFASTPYQDVATVFKGFMPSTKPNRGGIPRPNEPRQSYYPRTREPSYHVEMSFTEEQRPYAVTALACMLALSHGHVFGDVNDQVPTFTQEIENNYLNPKKKTKFIAAVTQSSLQLMTRFREYYPNLMPALNAVFRVAGAEGMQLVTVVAADSLRAAKSGELTRENKDVYWGKDVWGKDHVYGDSHKAFTRAHPSWSYTGGSANFEIWCTGEALARDLMEQSKIAIFDLIESGTTVEDKYINPRDFSFYSRHASKLNKDVAKSYGLNPSFNPLRFLNLLRRNTRVSA